MPAEDLKYLIAFGAMTGLGPVRLKKIRDFFPSMQAAWGSSLNGFLAAGLDLKIAEELIESKKSINPDEEYEKCLKEDVFAIDIKDRAYPYLLKEIPAPPQIIYFKGSIKNYSRSLAVVGTRKISNYGKMVTEEIISRLAQCGFTIVSGLAMGVDSVAHQTALREHGQTIAVLGSGLARKNIYPASNHSLLTQIIDEGGLILSEFPLQMPPLKSNFPQRNRIISGLSLGTLVIEAPRSSGALITAKYALEQNREVLAVPGSIFNQNSTGTNNLIKQGAHPVSNIEDILEVFDIKNTLPKKEDISLTPQEMALLDLLTKDPIHIDELSRQNHLPIAKINSTLTILEIKGAVKNLGGGIYCKMA